MNAQEAADAAEQAALVREELGEIEVSRREMTDAHLQATHTTAALEAAVQASAADCAAAEANFHCSQQKVGERWPVNEPAWIRALYVDAVGC